MLYSITAPECIHMAHCRSPDHSCDIEMQSEVHGNGLESKKITTPQIRSAVFPSLCSAHHRGMDHGTANWCRAHPEQGMLRQLDEIANSLCQRISKYNITPPNRSDAIVNSLGTVLQSID